jgi:hypothetical protein
VVSLEQSAVTTVSTGLLADPKRLSARCLVNAVEDGTPHKDSVFVDASGRRLEGVPICVAGGRSALRQRQQRFRYPDQKALYDWQLLQGTVFAYAHRVGWELPAAGARVCLRDDRN